MLKKIIASFIAVAVTIGIAVDAYILFLNPQKQAQASQSVGNSSTKASAASTSQSHSTQSSSATSSAMKDGTYTGSSTSTRWGDVQVQIKVTSGKITTVNVLSYPDSENKSVQINQQALPIYKSEAMAQQSADIQQVSGATETYKGFTGSLQDAVNQAQA